MSYNYLPIGEYRFEVRVQEREGLVSEVASLAVRVVADEQSKWRILGILSQSAVMVQLLKKVEQVAETDTRVLVLGETGVGKGLLTRTIHKMSPRREQAFIVVNCGALPAGLVESQLFGYEKGAFTGAVERHIGFFEQAHGGTLFLDEIGDLPLEAQRVLLHILEEDHLMRVGGKKSIPVDVRVVAATNCDLRKAVGEGTFREDLYYRLSVFPVVLPPLRERWEDIPLLVTHFVHQYAQQSQRPVPTLSDEVMAYLQGHTWPGNVRELAHRIERAVIVCVGGVIEVADVRSAEGGEALLPPASAPAVPLVEAEVGGDWGAREVAGAKAEKQQIEEALRATNGRIYGEHGAAQLLGMGPEKLRYYMRKYGVKRPKKS